MEVDSYKCLFDPDNNSWPEFYQRFKTQLRDFNFSHPWNADFLICQLSDDFGWCSNPGGVFDRAKMGLSNIRHLQYRYDEGFCEGFHRRLVREILPRVFSMEPNDYLKEAVKVIVSHSRLLKEDLGALVIPFWLSGTLEPVFERNNEFVWNRSWNEDNTGPHPYLEDVKEMEALYAQF